MKTTQKLFETIHPNRWFIWTIALVVMIFIIVWGAIERYAIEQEITALENQSQLGRFTSKLAITEWKTYRNEKYGFEFKYPENLNLKTDTSGYITISEGGVVNAKELVISSLRWKDPNRTLAEFIHNYNGYDEEDVHTQFGNESKEFINGIGVYTFEVYYSSRSEMHYFFLKNKEVGIDAFYTLYANENPNGMPSKKFQQILSTFKFFEPKR